MFTKPALAIMLVLGLAVTALATRVHVNSGCIRIQGKAVCAKNYRDMDGGARIEARFAGNRERDYDIVGCVRDFVWPRDYGDVYFGSDSCLYDSKGQNINGQCCKSGSGGYKEKNPYRW